MSLQEIRTEAYRGYLDILPKIDQKGMLFSKMVLKRRPSLTFTPIVKNYKILSKNNIEFVLTIAALSRKDVKTSCYSNVKFIYRRDEGLYLGHIKGDGDMCLWSPHSLKRYKERIAKRSEMTIEEIMDDIYDPRKGPIMALDYVTPQEGYVPFSIDGEPIDDEDLVGLSRYGLVFAHQEWHVTMIKTIIGYETLNDKQKKYVERLQDKNQYWERAKNSWMSSTLV